MCLLKIKQLHFRYNEQKEVLKGIDMEFEKGICYGIFGKSGAGKSTLLSLLAGLETVEQGQIYFKGKDLAKMNLDAYRKDEIGIIFQSYNLLPHLTAIENITLSMDISHIEGDKLKLAKKLLTKVGLKEELWNRRVLQLSGGEQQRVAIARAISYDSDLILADEPTGNLDPEMEEEIINLLLSLAHQENKCVIIISHSKEIKKKVDKVCQLTGGKLTLEKEKGSNE